MTEATSLDSWLTRLEQLHPRGIDLGLERVRAVLAHMGRPKTFPVITVGGTNGKGSVCAYLEAILVRAGYRVGCYTSPHLLAFNERIRMAGEMADDAAIVAAFERVEAARLQAGVTLTYFEFGTLAAWDMFCERGVEVAILEVGLGGRLDAVNVFDTDCAVITAIDLDHQDWLGDTREAIGLEKAGIFREGVPAIVADPRPPATLLDYALDHGVDLRLIGRDFGWFGDKLQWTFWLHPAGEGSDVQRRGGLAPPGLRGTNQFSNASAALAALDTLRERLPVAMGDIRRGLLEVELPGRFQVLPGRPVIVLDVAHNPHAARTLAANLGDMAFAEKTHAVVGMLGDKDIAGTLAALRERVAVWHVATLDVPRGASAETLQSALSGHAAASAVFRYTGPVDAYRAAAKAAGENDRILVFGSFHTVADVMREIRSERRQQPVN